MLALRSPVHDRAVVSVGRVCVLCRLFGRMRWLCVATDLYLPLPCFLFPSSPSSRSPDTAHVVSRKKRRGVSTLDWERACVRVSRACRLLGAFA